MKLQICCQTAQRIDGPLVLQSIHSALSPSQFHNCRRFSNWTLHSLSQGQLGTNISSISPFQPNTGVDVAHDLVCSFLTSVRHAVGLEMHGWRLRVQKSPDLLLSIFHPFRFSRQGVCKRGRCGRTDERLPRIDHHKDGQGD